MRRLPFLLALILAVPFVASAQDSSKFELFGGYNYTRVSDSSGALFNYNGGGGDVGFFPVRWIGVVGAVDYSHSSGFTDSFGASHTAPTNALSYLGGPRIRFSVGRFTPYVETLFGAIHRSNLETSTGIEFSGPETSFAYYTGGGIDVRLVHHVSLRLVQVGFLHSQFTSNTPGANASQNDFNIQTGIVIH
jgi:hypothetical protein